MAKGAEAKLTVTQKILEAFDGAFVFDKEIRIPVVENGETVQIKVVLTCAKTNVAAGGDTAVPGVKATKVTINEGEEPVFEDVSKLVEPSADEIKAVSDLMSALNL